MIQGGRAAGLDVSGPAYIMTDPNFRDLTEARIKDNLVELNKKYGPLQIVLVIMSAQPSDLYSKFHVSLLVRFRLKPTLGLLYYGTGQFGLGKL